MSYKKIILGILILGCSNVLNAQSKKWTLEECVTYAIENNITLKQEQLKTHKLEQDLIVAKGDYLPSVNASSSASFNIGSSIDIYGSRISKNRLTGSLGLSIGTTVFEGFRKKYTLDQAKKSLEIMGFNFEETKNTILLYTVNGYLNILLAKENIIIANEQERISQKLYDRIEKLVEAGVEPMMKLTEIKATLAQDKQRRVETENELSITLINLAQLLQLPIKGFDIEDVSVEMDVNNSFRATDQIFEKAITILPEIKSAELSIESAELDKKIAKTVFYPKLSVGLGANTSYQDLIGEAETLSYLNENNELVTMPNGFQRQIEDNLGYNVGLSLSIPIFNAYRAKTNYKKSKINKELAELDLVERKTRLRENIEKAHVDAQNSLQAYKAAQLTLEAQRLTFDNAQKRYDEGIISIYEFEQIKSGLANAKSSLATQKFNVIFKTKLLDYYYGDPIKI